MKTIKKLILCIIILIFSLVQSNAHTHYVSKTGNNTAPYLTWETAAKEIQTVIDGMNALCSHDVIMVSNGVYNAVIISNKVTWLFEVRSVNGAGVTIIDAKTNSRCLVIDNSITKLIGFTLVNGKAYDGLLRGQDGGAAILNSGTLLNCFIKNSICDGYGGGVKLLYDSKILYCTIVSNTSRWGGGGVFAMGAGNEIHNSIIVSNLPNNIYGDTLTCSYSCIMPLVAGESNISVDPLFIDNTNWLLKSNSPCIDFGTDYLCNYDGFLIDRPLDGNNDGIADYDIGPQEIINPSADTDKDGIPDWWEILHNTKILMADDYYDGDNDGASNFQEYLAGTDPKNYNSVFKITKIQYNKAFSNYTIQFSTVTNRTYSLEGNMSITNYTWSIITNNVLGTGTNVDVIGTDTFYRARCWWTNYLK